MRRRVEHVAQVVLLLAERELGEHGVLRSLEQPVYIVALKKKSVVVFTRESALVELEIDPTEYLIKVGDGWGADT